MYAIYQHKNKYTFISRTNGTGRKLISTKIAKSPSNCFSFSGCMSVQSVERRYWWCWQMNRMTLCWIIVFCRRNFSRKNKVRELLRRKSMFINYLSFPSHRRAIRKPLCFDPNIRKNLTKSQTFLFCFVFHLIYFFISFISFAMRTFCFCFIFVIVIRSDTAKMIRMNNDEYEMRTHFHSECQFQAFDMDDDTSSHAKYAYRNRFIFGLWFVLCAGKRWRQFLWVDFTSTVCNCCWRLLFMCLGATKVMCLKCQFPIIENRIGMVFVECSWTWICIGIILDCTRHTMTHTIEV